MPPKPSSDPYQAVFDTASFRKQFPEPIFSGDETPLSTRTVQRNNLEVAIRFHHMEHDHELLDNAAMRRFLAA